MSDPIPCSLCGRESVDGLCFGCKAELDFWERNDEALNEIDRDTAKHLGCSVEEMYRRRDESKRRAHELDAL